MKKYWRLLFVPLIAAASVAASTTLAPTKETGTKVQLIYVRNLSTFVSDKVVANTIPAFQAATTLDFAPIWKVDAKLIFIGHAEAPRGTIVISLMDKSDVKGALAYHGVKDGVPFSKVFVGTSRYYGYSWPVGFTHEEWEMLADPYIDNTMQDPFQGTIWANEIADPVEADNLGYKRPGANGKPVLISDFITPKWYGAEQTGPYDFLNHVQYPLQILPGGYAQYWDGRDWILIDNFKNHGKGRAVHY